MEPGSLLPHWQCPPAVPILNQISPVHVTPSHLLKIRFNIILPSTPSISSKMMFLILYILITYVLHEVKKVRWDEIFLQTLKFPSDFHVNCNLHSTDTGQY
jgi:hypothetical protein